MLNTSADPTHYAPRVPSHVRALDGIRGIAVLAVLVRHLPWPGSTPTDKLILSIINVGSYGVDLFFVLSGYLITGILLDSRTTPGYFAKFYARRSLRIFPLYYLALVLAFAVMPHVLNASLYRYLIGDAATYSVWYWLYGCNILFAIKQTYFGMAHFWSLAVEEQFYILWPVVVYMVGPRRLPWIGVGCIALAMTLRWLLVFRGVDLIVGYVLMPTRLDGLAIGALLACAARSPGMLERLLKLSRAWIWLVMGVLGSLLLASLDYGRTSLIQIVGGPLVGILFGWLVLLGISSSESSAIGRLFGFSPIVFLGKYSYCLYVCHPFVFSSLEHFWSDSAFPLLGESVALSRITLFVVGLILSVGISLLSWNLFEKHFLRLKKYFEPCSTR